MSTEPAVMTGSRFQYLIPEILGQIFFHCLPDDSEHPNPRVCDAPLKFGRVCSYWRQVAESTPSLWSCLEITIDAANPDGNLSPSSDSRYAQVARLFMERSCSLPVSITVRCASFTRNTGIHVNQITEELLKHSSRWKSLKLDTVAYAIRPFLTALHKGAPLLEKMQVYTPKGEDWRFRCDALDLEGSPRLMNLELYSGIYSLKTPTPHLINLRHLAVTGNIENLFTWVEHCPAVEHLYVDIDPGLDAPPWREHLPPADPTLASGVDDSNVMELSHLTRLTIRSDYEMNERSGQTAKRYLDHFRAPALQSLCLVVDVDDDRDQFARHFRDFLERSSPPLFSLKLRTACIPPDGLAAIIALTPFLCDLELYAELVTDAVLETLTIPCPSEVESDAAVEAVLCPYLCGIKLALGEGMSTASEAALVRMVVSRCRSLSDPEHSDEEQSRVTYPRAPFGRLLELELIWFTDIEFSLCKHPAIASLVDAGLKVIVSILIMDRELFLNLMVGTMSRSVNGPRNCRRSY